MKVIEDLRPGIIITSPSWAITLAEEAARRSLDLTELLIKKIWLTGEGCSPAFRRRVEKLWGAPANFFYGSLECGALGIECDAHNGYHVPEAHVLMEVVDPRTGERLGASSAGPPIGRGPAPSGRSSSRRCSATTPRSSGSGQAIWGASTPLLARAEPS